MDVMRYDERIDDVILKILCTQPSTYLKLKRNVDSVFKNERLNHRLKGSISFETFNSHLKGLVRCRKVKRQEQKPDPSSKVFYSVTKEVNCYAYNDKSFIDILRAWIYSLLLATQTHFFTCMIKLCSIGAWYCRLLFQDSGRMLWKRRDRYKGEFLSGVRARVILFEQDLFGI